MNRKSEAYLVMLQAMARAYLDIVPRTAEENNRLMAYIRQEENNLTHPANIILRSRDMGEAMSKEMHKNDW